MMSNGNSDAKNPFFISCVIMAAGVSRRFQNPTAEQLGMEKPYKNKLLADFSGKPLIQWTLDSFSMLPCLSRLVVVRDEELFKMSQARDFQVIWNRGADLDPSITIRAAMSSIPPEALGCLFAVGDQPYLSSSSIRKLCDEFMKSPDKIVSLSWQGKRGNPVIFPKSLFSELSTLEHGSTGKTLIRKHPDQLILVEAEGPFELMDIDTQEQYVMAKNKSFT